MMITSHLLAQLKQPIQEAALPCSFVQVFLMFSNVRAKRVSTLSTVQYSPVLQCAVIHGLVGTLTVANCRAVLN